MKKLLFVILLMLVGISTASARMITATGTKPAVGNGNSGSPYEIRTAEELRWFVNYENTRHWYPNDYAVLRCDIDLSSICGPDKGSWIPLGYAEESGAKDHWYGNLNGNGCTITGMYIDGNDFGSAAILGFCGTVTSATIKNLVVTGDIVNAPSTTGGLVGYIKEDNCVITSCESEVNISTSKNNYIGGLVGYIAKASQIEVTRCAYNGIIKCPNGSGNDFAVGTLIGQCQGKGDICFCSSYSHPYNSQSLPMIYRLTDNTDITTVNYNIHQGSNLIRVIYDCYYRLQTNYLSGWPFCETELKTSSEVGGNKTYSEDEFASGKVCYDMNQEIMTFLNNIKSRTFYQTIGTDPIPYAISIGHEPVFKVKGYTDCQNYTDIYNNTGLDTNKKHTFDAEHDHCTVCREVLNPDYATKDDEGYFQIGTKAQMLWFIELCNTSDTPNYKMKLTDDINMEAVVQDPIHEFWGQIEGEGHVLNNVYISSNDQYVGLVGNLKLNPIPNTSSGTIRNLTMNGFVQGKAYTQYVGAFAGKVEGSESRNASLYNVRNDCQVIYNGENPGAYNNTRIGGIVGQLDGSLIYGLNNGHVYDYVNRTQETDDGIAGIAGRKTKYSKMWYVINNGEVGSAYDSYKNRGAVANNEYGGNYEQVDVGYVKDIPPTLGGFYYSNIGDYSTGASQQAEALDRIRLASGEFCLSYFRNWGQKIGVDDAPFPVINDEHPKVYNKRYYYNCTDYSNYSNVDEDGEPREHEYNDAHYCIHCYHLDPYYLAQDEDKAYLITTPAQWNTFAAVVNQAAAAGTVMSFASVRLAADLSFDYSTGFTALNALNGKLDGAGHKMSFTAAAAPTYVVGTTSSYGSISNLYVDFPNEDASVRTLCGEMNGTMSGCSVTKGVPTLTANGLVSDCTGQTELSVDFKGCYKRVLIKLSDNLYRIYTGGEPNGEAPYTTYTADGVCTGEVAYALSHADPEQECLWGQELGTDTWPRIIVGLTPSSDEFVAKVTSYDINHLEGKMEYVNANAVLEYAPGYFKVSADSESFTVMKTVTNFVVDNGDGTYTAESIEIDPATAVQLPMQVQADKFTFNDTREFEANKVVSVLFPVDMPLANINGRVFMFDSYDPATKTILFSSNLDMERLPANSPALVIAKGGNLLVSDALNDVTVLPMTGANDYEKDGIHHLTSYHNENMGEDYVAMDNTKMALFRFDYNEGTFQASLDWTSAGVELAPFAAYIAFPSTTSGMDEYTTSTQTDVLQVDFTGQIELTTSKTMTVDLFALPYGNQKTGQWAKVDHNQKRSVFFGEDYTSYGYADVSEYDRIELYGTPNQQYTVSLVRGESKESFDYNQSSVGGQYVTLDEQGKYTIDLTSQVRYVGLIEIESTDHTDVAYDATGKAYKTLGEDGIVLSGYGSIPAACQGYTFYDASGVKSNINFELDNPNALVLAGDNITGVTNHIRRSNEVEQGFTAESLSITDGHDFCYDFSVLCPNVTYTRDSISAEDQYATAVLPFAVNATEGVYKYVDCDGNKVYFETPATATIPAYTPIVVDVTSLSEITLSGANLQALIPNGTFNLTDAPSSTNSMKYGFVTKRQESVSVTGNAEVSSYNVYGYSTKSHQFVRTTGTFSISPFRAFFLLPKSTKGGAASLPGNNTETKANGYAATTPSALKIVINGKEIGNTTSIDDVDFDARFDIQNKRYNLLGQPVGSDYKGIVIQSGKKVIIK